MIAEPPRGRRRHLFQRAGLLEEVRRPRYEAKLRPAAQVLPRGLVDLEHLGVTLADDEQRRRRHLRQCGTREVRTAAPRDTTARTVNGRSAAATRAAAAPVLAPNSPTARRA